MQTDPRHIKIADYNYELPDERIAKYPLAERSQSKLLVYRPGAPIEHRHFCDIPKLLPKGTLLVMNNTRVIQARLHFTKATGACIEVFLLEPHTPKDYQLSFAQRGSVSWTCLVGNLKKWKGEILERSLTLSDGTEIILHAERHQPSATGHEVLFTWESPEGKDAPSFSEILEAIGELPIPPYLNRSTEESDLHTYQTVYSKIKGSVAAPTAGLHFTDDVLAELRQNDVELNEVTLHVGAGTFRPVKSEEIGGHPMHAEWISVSRATIERILAHGGHCTAVGTTSVRTLESLYYIGCLIKANPSVDDLHISQWMPYDEPQSISSTEALQAILAWMDERKLQTVQTSTQIIIAPGYTYHVVENIITNFHQPQSTLLLLVSAFVKGEWKSIYDYALSHDFRFLSYGDSSLLMGEGNM